MERSMQSQRNFSRKQWQAPVDKAIAEADDDLGKQQEAIARIKLEWGPEAADYAERRFAQYERREDDIPILSKDAPFDNAKEFARRYCYRDGILTTRYWNDDFWEWNGCWYEKTSEDKLTADVLIFLDTAKAMTGAGTVRFRPKPHNVEAVVKFLKACLRQKFDPPCWNDGRKAHDVIVFKNGIVDIGTGRLSGLTPELWTIGGLEFDYHPAARCPVWEKFLDEVFEKDPETAVCIEEQLGLGMTWDNRFQQGAIWIGPKGREGKGTLALIHQN
jgi:putative DNA primase/helicase